MHKQNQSQGKEHHIKSNEMKYREQNNLDQISENILQDDVSEEKYFLI